MVFGEINMKDNNNDSWYMFTMVVCMNKEHCKEDHTTDPFRNMGFDEMKYICRIFTNRFCEKLDCSRCNFTKAKDEDDECLILRGIQKLRGTYIEEV